MRSNNINCESTIFKAWASYIKHYHDVNPSVHVSFNHSLCVLAMHRKDKLNFVLLLIRILITDLGNKVSKNLEKRTEEVMNIYGNSHLSLIAVPRNFIFARKLSNPVIIEFAA